MLHIYDEINGAHIESVTEGSDTSRWGVGYQIITAHLDDPKAFKLAAGELVPLSDAEALAVAKLATTTRLSQDYEAYADSRYNIAWQSSAREFRETSKEVVSSDTATTQQKAAAQQILDRLAVLKVWLFQGIMGYYAAKATEISTAADLMALEQVSWDFSTLSPSDPQISITSELYPLLITATAAQ